VVFALTLQTHGEGAYRRLRRTLKTALRRDGLRAIDVREQTAKVSRCSTAQTVRTMTTHSRQAIGATQMSLGKRKGSDFMPVFKYDANAGSFYKQDRVLTQDGWGNEQTDVGNDLRAGHVIFDLDHIKVGWLNFPKGAAPETVLFPPGQDIGDAPAGKDFKQGFRIIVKLDGDVPREFMSTAAATWHALDTLHEAFCNQRKKHPGKVAKVKLTDVIETKAGGGSTTFTPVFQLAEFVARPPDLPASAPDNEPRKPAKPAQTAEVKRSDMDDEIPSEGDASKSGRGNRLSRPRQVVNS
jgi:hypothetical protein